MYKNKTKQLELITLLDDTDSQSPQDTQEKRILKPIGLAGGDNSAIIRVRIYKTA